MKDKIQRLLNANYDETTIVAVLGITHRIYRKLAPSNSITIALPLSAKWELKHGDYPNHTLEDLANLYKTTYSQIHYSLYQKLPPQRPAPTPENVLEYMMEHDSIEGMRKHFGLNARVSTLVLQYIGWQKVFTAIDKERLSELIASNEYTYKDIAVIMGCHHQTVVKHAKAINHKRQAQGVTPWSKVIEYAKETSVSSAAKLYNVSRASIYYHMHKTKKETV